MVRLITILLSLCLVSGAAIAGTTEMTCKNARRGYVAIFDAAAKTFTLEVAGSVTPYQVNKVDKGPEGTVVRGKTVKGGPDFVAYLGKKKRIEFIDGGELMQTDLCK